MHAVCGVICTDEVSALDDWVEFFWDEWVGLFDLYLFEDGGVVGA